VGEWEKESMVALLREREKASLLTEGRRRG
jgi:hypothetical protein